MSPSGPCRSVAPGTRRWPRSCWSSRAFGWLRRSVAPWAATLRSYQVWGLRGYLAAAVGVALALLAAHWMLRRRTVVITRGALVVTERSLLRGRAWREPLSSYREIRCHVEQRRHRYGRRSWYVARLWHPEPGKRVELARARDLAVMEERARDCARRLGLPLVWGAGATVHGGPGRGSWRGSPSARRGSGRDRRRRRASSIIVRDLIVAAVRS